MFEEMKATDPRGNMNRANNYFGIYGASKKQGTDILADRLITSGAMTESFERDGVVLAVWDPVINRRGVWKSTEGGIVFDLDLTYPIYRSKEKRGGIQDDGIGCFLWKQFQAYGIEFVEELRGAFSFLIWDAQKKLLLVITDPFGIRPIVYAEGNGSFSAGSLIRNILIDKDVDISWNLDAVYHYLFFQAICSPLTIYNGIRKLSPGNAIKYNRGKIEQFTYYDIEYNPDKSFNETYWRGAVFKAMERAVDAYVPLSDPRQTGCYLSGGTDSSSIAGLYTQLSGAPANTFSIGFDEPAFNELDYAYIAARHFGTTQHDYFVKPGDVVELLYFLPDFYDEPFGNSSVVPAYYCAKLAKENGMEVLLGGDGGDEIFGGNERYVKNLIFSLYHSFPNTIRKKIFEPFLYRLPNTPPFFQAKRYVRRSNMENPDRFFSYNLLAEISPQKVFHTDFLNSVDLECFLNLARELYRKVSPAHETDRLLYLDMKFTITDNDLRKVTRMAEAIGVQVRYPFLDRDLVDFSATIPPHLKVKWGKGRYIFKRAMEGFLPDEIIHKNKHGMGLPIALWFKKDPHLKELLYDELFTKNPIITQWIRREFLDNLRNAFENDVTTYYGNNLWVFLMLEIWMKQVKSKTSR